jgi:hypothetical protein
MLYIDIVFPFQTHNSMHIVDKTSMASHRATNFINAFFLLSECITNAISIIIRPNRKLFFQNNSSIT